MNAYELVDEYEFTKKEYDAFVENPTDANRIAVLCKRNEFALKLIRQQADRIAELEKDLALKTRDRDVFRDFTLAYEKRIEELEKVIQDGIKTMGAIQEQELIKKFGNPQDVSSKPVAWWTAEFNDEADDFMFDKTKQNHMNHINSRTHEFFPIPLYTHPHSAESVKVKQLSDEEIDKITLQFWERPFVEAHRNFARAIIKEITE